MPSYLVPGRDARHRRACLSLFRALFRQGRRVPLPDDIATGLLPGPANPIQSLIRSAFRRNRAEESHRLVVSALKNGYRFLALLDSAAQTPPQPVRDEVLSLLRHHQGQVRAMHAREAAKPPKRPARPPPVPFLTLVSDNPPVYKRTAPALPLSEVRGGVRKPPRLDCALALFPFLRLHPVQAKSVSRALKHRILTRQAYMDATRYMRDQGIQYAIEEDNWERLVENMLGENAVQDTESYRSTAKSTLTDLQDFLTAQYTEALGRGKALWEVVEEETALAKREDHERRFKAREERLARDEAGQGESEESRAAMASLEKFQRHLEEKRSMWPPPRGVVRRKKEARLKMISRLHTEEEDQQLTPPP